MGHDRAPVGVGRTRTWGWFCDYAMSRCEPHRSGAQVPVTRRAAHRAEALALTGPSTLRSSLIGAMQLAKHQSDAIEISSHRRQPLNQALHRAAMPCIPRTDAERPRPNFGARFTRAGSGPNNSMIKTNMTKDKHRQLTIIAWERMPTASPL